jgi:redox-sensitive bicupin YhaK (pirin superfamily)
MITKREGGKRGQVKWSWLNAKHTFSFGSYFDPDWMGFGPLRVINEDVIDGGRGFDTHPHKDMEIISYIIDGEIEHKDTLGNSATINPQHIQIMSAGTGIYHSEFNPNPNKETHSLQIWIEPNKLGVKPRYEQYDVNIKEDELQLLVSPDGGENIASIYQDLKLYHAKIKNFSYAINPKKKYWVQIVRGSGVLSSEQAQAGDGFAIEKESNIEIKSLEGMTILFFEM